METDARRMRSDRPFLFTNLKDGTGLGEVVEFVIRKGGISP